MGESVENQAQLSAEAEKRGAFFARFWSLADDDDFDVVERETVRIAHVGGIEAITIRCIDFGEEADLLDCVGFFVGRVHCDGSIEWKESV